MCGDLPSGLPRFPKNKKDARAKRGNFKAKSHTGRRGHGVHQVLPQGAMGSHQGIIQPIRGCPQFPYTAGIFGSRLARGAKINLATKSIRLAKGILDIQAPKRPLVQGLSAANERICDPHSRQCPHCPDADPGSGIPWPPIALSPYSHHHTHSRPAPNAYQPDPWTGCPISLVTKP